MNSLRKLHLDLRACELEDRLLPVVANLGMIVLTTGGHGLMIPYAGGSPTSAAVPASFPVTSLGVIFNTQPGDHGPPSLPATGKAGSTAGAGVAFTVSSAASDPAIASIPLVTRNTIANDATNPPPRIGRLSADRSPVLPAGEWYRGGIRENAPARPLPAPLLPLPPGDTIRSTD